MSEVRSDVQRTEDEDERAAEQAEPPTGFGAFDNIVMVPPDPRDPT